MWATSGMLTRGTEQGVCLRPRQVNLNEHANLRCRRRQSGHERYGFDTTSPSPSVCTSIRDGMLALACPRCGTRAPRGAKFCSECGAPVTPGAGGAAGRGWAPTAVGPAGLGVFLLEGTPL